MEPIRVGDFAFTVRPGDPPNCVPVDERWEPLAAVLTRAGASIESFVAKKSGANSEGVVGFFWGDGSEDVPAGKVYVHYLDKSQILDEEFFAAAAAAWAKALRESR